MLSSRAVLEGGYRSFMICQPKGAYPKNPLQNSKPIGSPSRHLLTEAPHLYNAELTFALRSGRRRCVSLAYGRASLLSNPRVSGAAGDDTVCAPAGHVAGARVQALQAGGRRVQRRSQDPGLPVARLSSAAARARAQRKQRLPGAVWCRRW